MDEVLPGIGQGQISHLYHQDTDESVIFLILLTVTGFPKLAVAVFPENLKVK